MRPERECSIAKVRRYRPCGEPGNTRGTDSSGLAEPATSCSGRVGATRRRASFPSCARCTQLVLDDLAALHDEGDRLEDADVRQRIAAHRDQIGVAAGLQGADVL